MNKNKNKKIGVLDIFIILAVVAVAACVVIRFIATNNSAVSEKVQLDEYVVSFSVTGIKDSSAKNYMKPGMNFYIKETGAYLGSLLEGLTIKDAEKFYEMPNGDVVIGENNAVGSLYRVDVEAKLRATGKSDENGAFLLNGNTYIGVNKTLNLNSKYLAITVTITDITKAQ